MKGLLVNQFFQLYFVMFIYEFMVYLIMCNSFKLKISKQKAFILAFVCSNFLPITDALSFIYIGGRIIPETNEVLLTLKLNTILEELILIGFIAIVFDNRWYRCYWLTFVLHTVLVIPYSAIYYGQFITTSSKNALIVRPMTSELLPKYIFIIIVSILYGSLFLLLGRYLRRLKKINQISKWIWFAIYSGWAYMVFNSNKSYGYNNSDEILKGVDDFRQVFLAVIIFVIIMFLSINQAEKKLLKVENNLLKEQNELQYANYLSMQQQEMQIHKLYHDIGNHIKTIQLLVSNNESQEAKAYAESLIQQFRNIKMNFFCNNRIINAVLSEKLKICDQSGISYEIDIILPEVLPVRDIDLMSVYSNLLDNAIEACRRNNNPIKYIKVKTAMVGNYFAVKIINSKSSDDSKVKDKFLTWKRDKSMHGYGLRILEEIVERYDGQKEILDNGEEFSAMIMLKTL